MLIDWTILYLETVIKIMIRGRQLKVARVHIPVASMLHSYAWQQSVNSVPAF